jgi:hypothetical protein
LVGFNRTLLLISGLNELVPGAHFRGRSKPPIGSSDKDPLPDSLTWAV